MIKRDTDGYYNRVTVLWQVFITFHLFTLGAIFFRAKSISDAWYILKHIFNPTTFRVRLLFSSYEFIMMVLFIVFITGIHLVQEYRGSIREIIKRKPLAVRWAIYYFFIMAIFMFMYETSQFIYFQF
jgi:hypothetical protein